MGRHLEQRPLEGSAEYAARHDGSVAVGMVHGDIRCIKIDAKTSIALNPFWISWCWGCGHWLPFPLYTSNVQVPCRWEGWLP